MTLIKSIVILRQLYYQQSNNSSTPPSESVDTSSFNFEFKMFVSSSVHRTSLLRLLARASFEAPGIIASGFDWTRDYSASILSGQSYYFGLVLRQLIESCSILHKKVQSKCKKLQIPCQCLALGRTGRTRHPCCIPPCNWSPTDQLRSFPGSLNASRFC